MLSAIYAQKVKDRRCGCIASYYSSRGIEGAKIFKDNADWQNFLYRLGTIVKETDTRCYAWAMIPNHFHLLLKTGQFPIATVMRRLLTGYTMFYNRWHRRYGHLFQKGMRAPQIEDHRAVGAGQAPAPGASTESILLLGLPGVGDQYGSAFQEVGYFRISGEFVS